MRVREITDPRWTEDMWNRFDYFNDYSDTQSHLKGYGDEYQHIIDRLDKGWEQYCKREFGK